MMAGARQPIGLVQAKGKKHLTKAEIEGRKNSEVRAEADNIFPPEYLNEKQKKEFEEVADELLRINIMTNLDCDALARYIVSRDNYIKFCELLNSIPNSFEFISAIEKTANIQDRAFKQCQSAAKELGLTISSRCKLVVPKKEEPKPNKFKVMSSG